MRTNVRQTSRASYHSLRHIDTQECRIARLLYSCQDGLAISEIAQKLRMDKSAVSARLGSLRFTDDKQPRRFLLDGAEMEVVEKGKRKSTVSNVTCLTWTVQPAGQPAQLTLNLN